ncbi:amino acid adenylation domain-containing protein [Amycolatopsis samaneae]|uniref:Amino acid adenylation domain-containing protein n=1 Tax=Amycolatopsis samaneae TaxID=664691 RepID=A0ABW5GY92_9PSEU
MTTTQVSGTTLDAGGALPPLTIDDGQRALAVRYALRRTARYPLGEPVITAVERFAATTPERVAVCDERETIGYAELAARARRIAGHLERSGVRHGDVVAVGGERGADVIAAFLASELLGAVYLPVDHGWPALRVREVLVDSGAAALLVAGPATEGLVSGASAAGRPLLAPPAGDTARFTGRPRLTGVDQVRYVLYTSGSTGKPKGALVEHQGMLNHLWAKVDDLELGERDRLAQTAPLVFDISVWQMLAPLLVGAEVHVLGDDRAHDAGRLLEAVSQREITVLETVPTLIRLMLDELAEAPPGALDTLRWLIATGEELPPAVAARWLRTRGDTALLNAYGPTECSDDVTHYRVAPPAPGTHHLPIGGPIGNVSLYVLRQDEQTGHWLACAPGEPGELYVGGVAVGRGYLGDPERTRDSYFTDPFEPAGTGRLYRTGDAVRLLPDTGVLEYLGRVDRQVKVAGVRMELPEIEAVLRQHPAVAACTVIARKPDAAALVARKTALAPADAGPARLVAYLTSTTAARPDELREFLAARLPLPMVPAVFVELPELPLTRNGKIDYQALPAPEDRPEDTSGPGATPEDPTERQVADVLAGLLGVHRVGRDDSFTELGGDSLLAMRAVALLRSRGFAVSLRDMLLAGSPRALATLASPSTSDGQLAVEDAAGPAASSRTRPLTPQQAGLYFHWRLEPDNPYYHYQGTLSLAGPLDRARLTAAWDALLTENPALLARFLRRDDELLHEYPQWSVPLPEFEDLSALPPAERDRRYHDEASAEATRAFDLENEPVFRVRAFTLDEREHRILVTTHEVMLDGWGATVLFRRLAELYGQPEPTADGARCLRYDRYLDWQQARLAEPATAEAGEFWRRELAGNLPVLGLEDLPRPRRRSYRAGLVERVLDAGVVTRMRALGARDGRTPFMYLLTAYALALGYYGDTDEVVIGAPIANRERPEQADVASFLLNMLPFRIRLDPAATVGELLERTSDQIVAGISAAHYPFGWMGRDLPSTSGNTPVFQTMLNMITYPAQQVTGGDVTFTFTELDTGYAKYDCELYVQRHGANELLAQFPYQTDIISEQTANRVLESTALALDAVVFAPGTPIVELDLLGVADHALLRRFAGGNRS